MDDMTRPRERDRTITVVSLVLTLVAVGAYITFGNSPLSTQVRSLLGVEDRVMPPVEAGATGAHAFLNTQPGSDRPVGFSPCRVIPYVVNPEQAPDDWQRYVEEAVGEVSQRTGLRFDDRGTTEDRDFDDRGTGGGDPEPVLIGWADEDEVGELADDVAGLGGPTMAQLGNHRAYVTGSVILDSDTTDRLERARDGDELQVALLLHELGHLVGLDHVDDTGELMYPNGVTRAGYGPGDVEGLAALGAIPCR
jgi:hypothetical protein